MSQKALSILVRFAVVAWVRDFNYRKDYGDTERLKVSLAENEWVHDNSIPAFPIDKNNPEHTAALQTELNNRKLEWDALRTATDKNGLMKREVFEQLYVDKGKLIVPEYFGNAGFRRSTVFYAAMVLRWENREKDVAHENDEISGLVPIRVVTYKNTVEKIIDQQKENEMQLVGAKRMDPLEQLDTANSIFTNGGREVDVRRLYPGSTGQKLFGLCQANHNWPQVKIIERLHYQPSNPDRIRWGPVRHVDLIKLNARFEAQRKREEGFKLSDKELQMPEIAEEEVATYFRDKSRGEGEGNAPKIMSKKDMEQYAKSHRINIVAKAMDSVLNNTQLNLSRYSGATGIVELGHCPYRRWQRFGCKDGVRSDVEGCVAFGQVRN